MTGPRDLHAPIRNDTRALIELAEFVRRLAANDQIPFVIQAQAIQIIRSLQK
jgi:hypothetical protein